MEDVLPPDKEVLSSVGKIIKRRFLWIIFL